MVAEKKGTGTVVRSTLRAVPATVPVPFFLVLLAAGMACGGCEQVDPLRQGLAHSSYQQEMRQLADEVSRKGLAKDPDARTKPLLLRAPPQRRWCRPLTGRALRF